MIFRNIFLLQCEWEGWKKWEIIGQVELQYKPHCYLHSSFLICLQMLRPIKILQCVLDRSQVSKEQGKQLRYHESPLKHLTGKLDKLVTLLLCPPKACSCKTTYFNLDFWNCLAGPSTSGGKSLSSVSWWCIEQQLTKQDA